MSKKNSQNGLRMYPELLPHQLRAICTYPNPPICHIRKNQKSHDVFFFYPVRIKQETCPPVPPHDTENTGWRCNCVDLAWISAWKRAPFHERPEMGSKWEQSWGPNGSNLEVQIWSVQSCVVLAWITRG